MCLRLFFSSRQSGCLRGLLGCLVGMAGMAAAQLPSPQLFTVFPTGAKAGSQVEVALTGADLEGAVLRFNHAGITAIPDGKDPKKQRVTVAADVVPGFYEVRVTGIHGGSNPRIFEVGNLPEITSNGTNTKQSSAQVVDWPCTVNGTVASQGTQWFRLHAKAGQSLALGCRAEELDSKLVASLALFDVNGVQLAQAARAERLEWRAAADGDVLVRLNDFLYKGGAEYFYRLDVGARLEPKAGPPILWPLPAVTTAEQEPNDASRPMPVTLPCEVAGAFAPARDADAFSFAARKGESWWIEATSHRLGLPTDPRVVVQRVMGDKVVDVLELNDGPPVPGMPDYDGSHRDPVGRFEAVEDGQYRLLLRDLNNNTGGGAKDRRYQLSLRRESPDFALLAIAVPPKDNTPGKEFNGPNVTLCGCTVRPGQTVPIRVLVLRRDAFQGEVVLRMEGLPPGVTSSESVVSGDTKETMVFITAAGNTQAWTGPVKVAGTATIAGKRVTREARGVSTLWNLNNDFIEPARSRWMQEIVLTAASDTAFPMGVIPASAVTAKSTARVAVACAVKGASKTPVKLKPMGIPGLDKLPELELPAGKENATYDLDVPALKLKPGIYTFWFKGSVTEKLNLKGKASDVALNLYSTPVTLKIE